MVQFLKGPSSLSPPSESRARRMPKYLRRWSTVALPDVFM